MDAYTEAKSMRLLTMYSRLLDGKSLKKRELAAEFGIAERSVQRDMESLRIFFAEEMLGREILYDPRERGYRLSHASTKGLTNSEILAVCKILLESRSMRRDEMMPILDKLLDSCVPDSSKKAVTSLIANERHHYVEPRHGRSILDGLWEIGQAIDKHCVMELEYAKMDGTVSTRTVEPVGLMFSEYYFYLVAFLHNDPRTDRYKQSGTLMPTIYRLDRIRSFTILQEHFTPAYTSRFQEGEFRKRIQFMFGGKLNRVRFKYTGPSIEAVLDRLPTAQIMEQDEDGWTIEVEVFGKGIEMWLRSQGEYVKALAMNNKLIAVVIEKDKEHDEKISENAQNIDELERQDQEQDKIIADIVVKINEHDRTLNKHSKQDAELAQNIKEVSQNTAEMIANLKESISENAVIANKNISLIENKLEKQIGMGDLRILVDGIGDFVALADDSGDFIGSVDYILHTVDIACGEGNDEMIDPDSLVFSEGAGGVGHVVGGGGDVSVAEADDVVGCFRALGDVTDQIMAGGIILVLARRIYKFYVSHIKKLLILDWNHPGLLPQGDAQCIPGIPNKVFVNL